MAGDRLADHGAEAGHQVEDAGRQAELVEDLGEHERAERDDLGGLEHDRAADRDGRRDLRGDLVQRVVPRRDRADDAERLADDHRVADLLLPLDPLELLGHRAEVHRRQTGLDHLRQRQRHAELGGDQ